jgi:hypothetical protein
MAKAAPHKKPKLTDGERHKRFVEMARKVTGRPGPYLSTMLALG